MLRLRFYDLRVGRLPQSVGLCPGDFPRLAEYINGAQRRLLYDRGAGDEGWWGTWAEVVFNVSRAHPYITLPPEIARLEMMAVCGIPIAVQNQFYEYLQFGAGKARSRWNQNRCCGFWPNNVQAYSRNNVITYRNLADTPQILRVYANDSVDEDGQHRVFFQGVDSNGTTVYTQDGLNEVKGEFVTIQGPFVDTTHQFARLTGIQKDVTAGAIQIFEVDPTTGAETLIHLMQPTEQTAWYRRYHLSHLPLDCCHTGIPASDCAGTVSSTATVQVSAMAKMELIPVRSDTDYCLLQNEEAIISECQAMRYEGMDDSKSAVLSDRKHKIALGLLNGELVHYLGKLEPAVNFAPFGNARLERLNVSMQ